MNSKRLRLVLLILIGLSALAFMIILVVGSNMLAAKSKDMVKLKLQSATLDGQLTALAQAKKEVERYGHFNAIADEVIPNDKDQAQAVLDISQQASASGIAIQSITFPASTLGRAVPAPANNGSSPTNAATAPASKVISQAKPVTGVPGLYSIELTIVPETGSHVPDDKQVTYVKLLDLLKRIERNRRTAQITQVNIQPLGSEGAPSQFINFSLTINIFIKP